MHVFAPLFALRTISAAAATTTAPTTRATNRTTTTTPMIAPDTCDAGTSPPGAIGVLVSSASMDWSIKEARSDDAIPLDETIVDSITAVAATEVP